VRQDKNNFRSDLIPFLDWHLEVTAQQE